MRAIVFNGAGGNEVVSFEERATPTPSGDDVLVAVRYAGLNPADIAQRNGHYPAPPGSPPDIPGIEVAGTVIACGPSARRFVPGDRVFGLVGGGGLADHVLAHELHVTGVPEQLDELAAAAVPEVFVTAHDAVLTQAGAPAGELLVVSGANGGVGSAAVQIASAAGARVLATVRAAEVRGARRRARSDRDRPGRARSRARRPRVVPTSCSSSSVGPNLDADFLALAMKGRIVIVGTGAGGEATLDIRKLMGRRARLFGTMLRARPLDEKATAMRAFTREVVPHLASGRIAPLVDRVFPAEEAALRSTGSRSGASSGRCCWISAARTARAWPEPGFSQATSVRDTRRGHVVPAAG